MADLYDFSIGMALVTLAGVLWHRAVPAVLPHEVCDKQVGVWRRIVWVWQTRRGAIELWMLGGAAMLYGSGRVLAFAGMAPGGVYDMAHAFLALYVFLRARGVLTAHSGKTWVRPR